MDCTDHGIEDADTRKQRSIGVFRSRSGNIMVQFTKARTYFQFLNEIRKPARDQSPFGNALVAVAETSTAQGHQANGPVRRRQQDVPDPWSLAIARAAVSSHKSSRTSGEGDGCGLALDGERRSSQKRTQEIAEEEEGRSLIGSDPPREGPAGVKFRNPKTPCNWGMDARHSPPLPQGACLDVE
ncbi:hypothetical protein FOZ62_029827, partial [Perkinsus olseni]